MKLLSSGRGGTLVIGNNIFIGMGAKIVSPVTIMDDFAIDADVVVTISMKKGITIVQIGGVSARKISDNNSKDYAANVFVQATDNRK